MSENSFVSASPYQEDLLALPVLDIDTASAWYCQHFGMTEVERTAAEPATVILQRDAIRLGFAVNGGDASQDGAAIVVANVAELHKEFQAAGVNPGKLKIEKRDGKRFNAFFVVAPDGLCFYLYQEVPQAHSSGFWQRLKQHFTPGS